MTIDELVERFQCPGCVCGSDIKCGHYQYDTQELRCISHVLGTSLVGGGIGSTHFALGLPRGFNRAGFDFRGRGMIKLHIRLFLASQKPEWNKLNVPVWALERDGFLFVRTFAPRVDCSWVDAIEGGSLAMVPQAVNVESFYHEID